MTDLQTVMTFNPTAVSAHTTLDELIERLAEAGFHHWPVIDDEHRPIGIVSHEEIVRVAEARALAAEAGAVHSPQRIPVSEFMSRRVLRVAHDTGPAGALRTLLENGLHSLLVVEGERLIGIATTTDFLREFGYGECRASRELATQHLRRIEETLDATATLDEAAEFFLANGDYAGVLHGGCPLGVISRRDVLKARCRLRARSVLGDRFAHGPTSVAELVADSPLIKPGDTLATVANRMVERQRMAVGMVNQAQRLMGILSEEEVLGAMAGQARSASGPARATRNAVQPESVRRGVAP